MPIKNYTSGVAVFASPGKIQSALAKNGACKIMVDYNDNGEPSGIAFAARTSFGLQGFVLPARVEGVMQAFAREKVKVDRDQAIRTAWKNISDWVAAEINKYHNRKTSMFGIQFDSAKEARCFAVLREGEIKQLRLQEEFTLKPSYGMPDGTRSRAVRYVADFSYFEDVVKIVEDVKSRTTRTQKYIIKKKLMQEEHGITIRELNALEWGEDGHPNEMLIAELVHAAAVTARIMENCGH